MKTLASVGLYLAIINSTSNGCLNIKIGVGYHEKRYASIDLGTKKNVTDLIAALEYFLKTADLLDE